MGFPNEDSYSANLVAGVYDLYYVVPSADTGGAPDTLRNADALIRAGVDFTSDTRLDLDIAVVELSGALTVAGAPFGTGSGTVVIRRGALDFAWLGRVESGSYRALVLPGAYEIVYDGLSSFSSLHDGVRNSQYPLGSVVVTSSMTLDVDVPATRLTGRLTVDGGFRSGLRHSRIVLRRVGSEDEAALGDVPIRAEVYSAWVAPGRYNVVHVIPRVSSVVSGEVRNTAAILGCVVVP